MKIVVDVRRDAEAVVWYAVSRGRTGLTTESESLDALRQRILAVLPDLLEQDMTAIDVELVVHGNSQASGPIAAE